MGVVFLAWRSQQPTIPKAQVTKFLEKYCQRQDPGINIWECDRLYAYPGGPGKFEEDCNAIGYLFDCRGKCNNGQCYFFSSKDKTCSDSKDCESGWCKPIDENCITNCTGSCSENLPPDICSATEIFTFKAIENGKITDKQAGGAFCD